MSISHRKPNKPIAFLNPEIITRFRRYFDVTSSTECWNWNGRLRPSGYGCFRIILKFGCPRKNFLAHRVAYAIETGSDPANLLVLHSCDNRKCVNPSHLRTGTNKDNTTDLFLRNRMPIGGLGLKGDQSFARLHPEKLKRCEKNGNAKLTNEQVITMRKLFAEGTSRKKLATMFGKAKSVIDYALVIGWKGLEHA